MIAQASAAEQVSEVGVVKPKPSTQNVPAVLEPEDEDDLREYSRTDGNYMPNHSTFAAALLRAELKSMGCTGCRRCGGTKARNGKGFIPKELATEEPGGKRPKAQRKPRAPKGKRGKKPNFHAVYGRQLREYRKRQAKLHGWMIAVTPRQRDALRARGNDAYTRREIALFFPELPELQLKLCPACKGAGTVPRRSKERKRNDRITARPTGSSKRPAEGGGAEMDEKALYRRGKTDRRLAEVRKRLEASGKAAKYWVRAEDLQDVAGGVLETYFTPGNETLKSLWPFTHHGRMLLDGPNPNGLTVRARITTLLDTVHLSQDREKQGWIDLADREAQELLDLYIRTWNVIVAELVARSSTDAKGRKLKVHDKVLIFDDGKRSFGVITEQAREFWGVQIGSKHMRHVAGWHLERVQ